jgi:hypothetical protein
MKSKPTILTLGVCGVLFAAIAFPPQSAGQAGDEETLVQQALAEVAAQQTILADNQQKIDAKVALIAEEIRLARIFAGRTGGKTK